MARCFHRRTRRSLSGLEVGTTTDFESGGRAESEMGIRVRLKASKISEYALGSEPFLRLVKVVSREAESA